MSFAVSLPWWSILALCGAAVAVGYGAYDFYEKPVDVDTLQLIVSRAFHIFDLEAENRRLQAEVGTSPLDGIVAASEPMLRVCRMIEKVGPTSATVSPGATRNVTFLSTGTSGT